MKRTGLAARCTGRTRAHVRRARGPRTNAAGFCSDADRFHTDVAGEEFLKRRARYEREQTNYATKERRPRQAGGARWAALQEEKQQEDGTVQSTRDRREGQEEQVECL